MRIKDLLRIPTVKTLLYLYEKGEARYAELGKLIQSRGTLSLVLRELEEDGLVRRNAVTTKPIKVSYSLNQRGHDIASKLTDIKDMVDKSPD